MKKAGKKLRNNLSIKVEEKLMTNPQIHSEQASARLNAVEMVTSETEVLALQGFTEDEIISLLWLHQWYQRGGSDRVEVVRRLEFLKQLVRQGKMEL
jgi:hypothetical protein